MEQIIPNVCLLVDSHGREEERERGGREREGEKEREREREREREKKKKPQRLVLFGSKGVIAATTKGIHFCSSFFSVKRTLSFFSANFDQVFYFDLFFYLFLFFKLFFTSLFLFLFFLISFFCFPSSSK